MYLLVSISSGADWLISGRSSGWDDEVLACVGEVVVLSESASFDLDLDLSSCRGAPAPFHGRPRRSTTSPVELS